MLLYRLVREDEREQAFAGRGSARWKGDGSAVVVCATSRSLAVLELAANCDAEVFTCPHLMFEVELPDECVQRLAAGALPSDWRAVPWPRSTRDLGDAWAGSCASVGLAVPSALIPEETNVLLNVNHPDFGCVLVGRPERCCFDARVKR